MTLTRVDIEELKAIHNENFGEHLSDDEACEMGRRLMRLIRVLLRVPQDRAITSSNPVQFDRRAVRRYDGSR